MAVRRFINRHLFLAMLVGFAATQGPIYLRAEAIDRQRAVDIEHGRVEGCRLRNGTQVVTRAKFDSLIDAVEEIIPDQPAAVARLRMIVGSPQAEDQDCDADGRLDAGDYAPGDVPEDL